MRLTPLLLLFLAFHAIGQDVQSLRFIQNKGQWNPDIDFQAQVPGGRLGVSPKGFSIQLLDVEEMEHRHLDSHNHSAINEFDGHAEPIQGHYFQINLIGSNVQAKPVLEKPLDGHHNYFLGSDQRRWATHALAYASILYKDVYDGIDFRVSSLGQNLKYDFIVRPGADPSQIKIEYAGVDRIEKVESDLKIETSVGSLSELKPFSYQFTNTKKDAVSSAYKLIDNTVSFSFPDGYDDTRELTIDPLLIFSTYSGSTADNWGSTATPGEHGTLYSAGVTRQDLGGFFPATTGAFQTSNRGSFDMGIIKYDSLGTKFLYATHLGGVNNDSPESLVVDKASGDLLVLGISSSPDYPTSSNAIDATFNPGALVFNRVLNTNDHWDIVVTRLSPNGDQLIGSTFLGGSGNDGLNTPKQIGGPLVVNYGDEMRGDIITDETGHVYLTSVTASSDFPIVNGFDNSLEGDTDGVVIKMSPDLSSIVWSTYVGGSGFDAAYSIKFDGNKNVVVAGGTSSFDFPTTTGAYQQAFNGIVDGWIARIAANGSAILNATVTGTNSFDQIYFVDLNSSGNIYCYGQTAGQMPITAGVFHNENTGQFLQKFSSDLSTLEYSTVFGAPSPSGLIIPNISPTAFLVNDCDNIYMAGWGGFVNSSSQTGFWQSSTHNMPITNDAFQKTTSGSDFYFMVLNGDATELVYSTYLGGGSSKTHVDGGTSRFDKYGIVYHAVCSGCTFGNEAGNVATSDFPTTPNAKSRLNKSANCNNAAFKFDLSSLRAIFDTNNLALTMPGYNNVCYPEQIVFQNQSTGGRTIIWDFDDGTIVTKRNTDPRDIVHQYKEAGQYHVKLKITDLSTCSQSDSITKVITYFKDKIIVGNDDVVCEGGSYQLKASGGVTYSWTSEDGTFTSTDPSPVVSPTVPTKYTVTVIDENGCTKTDDVLLGITPYVSADFKTYNLDFTIDDYNNVCFPGSIRFKNQSINGETFVWDFDDGTKVNRTKQDTTSIIHNFQDGGIYSVQLKAMNPNSCNKADSVVKLINYFKDKIVIGNDDLVCEGGTYQLTASGGVSYSWSSEDGTFTSSEPSPTVSPSEPTTYIVTVIDENGCSKTGRVGLGIKPYVRAAFQTYNEDFSITNVEKACFPAGIRFKNLSINGEQFVWDFNDGTKFNTTKQDTVSTLHHFVDEGVYHVKLKAININTCNQADSVTKTITYFKDNIAVIDDGRICEGETFELSASGGVTYAWTSDDLSIDAPTPRLTVQPTRTTNYFVTVIDEHDCMKNEAVTVTVLNSVDFQWEHRYLANCEGRPTLLLQNMTPSEEGVTYHFDFGDGATSDLSEVEHMYERDGIYTIKVVMNKERCSYEETAEISIYSLRIPNVFTPDKSPGYNDQFKIGFGPESIAPSDLGIPVQLLVVDRWGKKVYESSNYKNDWEAKDLVSGVYFFHMKVGDIATCKSWVNVIK
ncbi:DUF7948 domain-containing protein [Pseudochryseolinea flava]|uniref:PKD domain-containing protein n=1 Tax=Pseudochryseolinea flava TaxID=2059302 RepID=A0A364Y7H1_9BACT|nr:PKD domain-containing protein [Pseudochryseolinea flava]RAW02211.1 hypothetical protein DQQ10_06625 [Pseudochryseolinea flava]